MFKKKNVIEGLPFGKDVLVFKVMNKIFCLANLNPPQTIYLKWDPELAVELREKYDSVILGHHTRLVRLQVKREGEAGEQNPLEY